MKNNINKLSTNTVPSIFTKKINNKGKIISFNPIDNTIDETRHYPPATREWYNSIYAYNHNFLKNLPVLDRVLTRIIKSYFNLSLPVKYLTKQYRKAKGLPFKRLKTRFIRLSLKRIFIGKAELKHTSNKVVITLFIYDGQKKFLERRANLLRRLNNSTENFIKWLKSNKFRATFDSKQKMFNNLNLVKTHFFDKSKSGNSNLLLFVSKKLKFALNPLNLVKSWQLSCGDNIKKIYRIKKKMHKTLMPLIKARTRLLINQLKFSQFIVRLTPLIVRLYGKKVEFNLVKLQRMYFNGNIFTQAIAIKLKNRNNRLLRVMRSALSVAKVPRINATWKSMLNKEGYVFANKAKNLSIGSLNQNLNLDLNRDPINQMLMYILPINTNSDNITKANNVSTENKSIVQVFSEDDSRINKLEGLDNLNNIHSAAFSKIKYKTMAGVRIEAKGRLTRRLTASRAVFKVRWKGGLKNIDSSYKRLSAVILRGHVKSNVEYSLANSKTRNGAFGVKGWVSGT